MKIFSFFFGKKEPKATDVSQQRRQAEEPSFSTARVDPFHSAMNIYRQCQPQIQSRSLSIPSFDKERLRVAHKLFSKCAKEKTNHADAVLMKAQCALDLYDRKLMAIALEDLNKIINPKSARAYDIRGSLAYALNDDKEKAVALAIEDKKTALDLDPQYSSDFGLNISLRSTTNEAFRSNLKGLEKELDEIRLKQRLQTGSKSRIHQDSSPLPEFREITSNSPHEATDALCKRAINSVPKISETEIRKHYLDVSSSWNSQQLFGGSLEEVTAIVLKNAQRLCAEPGFQNFQVKVYSENQCAQISAIFVRGGYSFQPVRMWCSKDRVFVCGNNAFESNA